MLDVVALVADTFSKSLTEEFRRAYASTAGPYLEIIGNQIALGIDRKALEATSDALLAMKRNLLAMSEGTALPSNREEADVRKKSKPRKSKKAA